MLKTFSRLSYHTNCIKLNPSLIYVTISRHQDSKKEKKEIFDSRKIMVMKYLKYPKALSSGRSGRLELAGNDVNLKTFPGGREKRPRDSFFFFLFSFCNYLA